MEVFLKSKELNRFMCIVKDGNFCREMTIAHFIDGSIDIAETKRCLPIDVWSKSIVETDRYEKSNKADFMEAYKNAKNTIKSFADKLIMK